jgi:hypothetical protein
MLGRIWHGWTTLANADAYESLLKSEIFVGIQGRDIPGSRGSISFAATWTARSSLSRSSGSTRSRPFALLQERITRSPLFRRRRGPCSPGSTHARSTMR